MILGTKQTVSTLLILLKSVSKISKIWWLLTNLSSIWKKKPEFLIIGSEHNLRSYSNLTLNVDTTEIKPVSSVRNLGVFFTDSDGSMTSQVAGIMSHSQLPT